MEENGIPGPVDAIANRRQDARERLAAIDDSANPPDSPRTKAIIDGVPVKRMGEPADVAHAVSFFVDARAGFVTGQILYVCGGMTVGLAS